MVLVWEYRLLRRYTPERADVASREGGATTSLGAGFQPPHAKEMIIYLGGGRVILQDSSQTLRRAKRGAREVGTLPASLASPPAARDAIASPPPLPQTHSTAGARRHGTIDIVCKLSARHGSQVLAQPTPPKRTIGGAAQVKPQSPPLT